MQSETKAAVENMKENIEQAQHGVDMTTKAGSSLTHIIVMAEEVQHKHRHPVLVLAHLRGQPGRE